MNKIKELLLIVLASLCLVLYYNSCTSITGNKDRIGAICHDGTRSSATGSGACSDHGGVKEWVYK